MKRSYVPSLLLIALTSLFVGSTFATAATILRHTSTPEVHAAPTTSTSTTSAPKEQVRNSPTTRPCMEDDPCWDCHTMGNLVCGPTRVVGP